jgi:hypothetical protein
MPIGSSSKHILNIAYDTTLMDSRERVLISAGYTVESVHRKHDALKHVLPNKFSLVLVGHSVPAPERDDLIVLIRACDPFVPIAFVAPSTESQSCASADMTIGSRPADLLNGVSDAIREPWVLKTEAISPSIA